MQFSRTSCYFRQSPCYLLLYSSIKYIIPSASKYKLPYPCHHTSMKRRSDESPQAVARYVTSDHHNHRRPSSTLRPHLEHVVFLSNRQRPIPSGNQNTAASRPITHCKHHHAKYDDVEKKHSPKTPNRVWGTCRPS